VDDLLLEDAELVAYAVRERRNLERRERIDEARGEPTEAAIAEPGLRLLGEQPVEVEPQVLDRVFHLIVDAEVDQVVAELGAEQIFGREVRDGTRARRRVRRRRADPAAQHQIANG